MTSDPLFHKCTQCGGRGAYVRPPVRSGNSISWVQGSEECEECEGFGITVTEEGRKIRDLVMAIKRGPKGWS
jgi:hypothetical protein